MNDTTPKRRLSLIRLLIVLIITAAVIVVGRQYVLAFVTDLRIGETSTWFAPYVDVTLTPIMHFEDQAAQLSDDVVLGFVVADRHEPCLPTWGTYYNLDAAARALDLDRRIVRLRERGGDAIVSFGGAANNELSTVCVDIDDLVGAYQAVITRYELGAIDFDIEGAAIADQEANSRRAKAVRQLQSEYKELEVWLTLPVAPHGLSEDAVGLIDDFVQAGVVLTGINLMTMNYSASRTPEMSMHEATVAALTATRHQLDSVYRLAGTQKTERELWQLIGATPMIGQNDVAEDIFTTGDAQALIDFARSHDLGRLSFWSINRDAPCGPGTDKERVSNTCSGVNQEPLEFTRIFDDGSHKRIPFGGGTNGQLSVLTTSESSTKGETFMRDDPHTSPYPLWRSEKAYEADSKVVWQGRVYQAKWWTEDEQPDAPVDNIWETPWRYLGPVLESDREAIRENTETSENWIPWTEEKVFIEGDEIEYNNQVFRAKWWSQGDLPQENPDQLYDHPWEYLGDVDCNGDSCVGTDSAATLSVDYESLTGVKIEIRHNDDIPDMAGKLVQSHRNQSGKKTYELLQGTYDLVFQTASAELIIDAVDCVSSTCVASNIATSLSVNYEGLTGITIEIRTNDGINGTAGDLVQAYENQGGQRSYSVLRGSYDLVFDAGAVELIVDSVECGTGCDVSDISAILAVDYDGLTGVHIEIRGNDGIDSTAGTLVQAHDDQRGRKTYNVLRGSYDLVFEKGAAELIIDAFDCSDSNCDTGDIVAMLTIDYGEDNTSVEIRAEDGLTDTAGGLVEEYDDQSGKQQYRMLHGFYDIVMKMDGSTTVHDSIDCSGETCTIKRP